jgi:hypothetical protein
MAEVEMKLDYEILPDESCITSLAELPRAQVKKGFLLLTYLDST